MTKFKPNFAVWRVAVLTFALLLPALINGGALPFADTISDDELGNLMTRVRSSIAQIVQNGPSHADFLAGYCRSESYAG